MLTVFILWGYQPICLVCSYGVSYGGKQLGTPRNAWWADILPQGGILDV